LLLVIWQFVTATGVFSASQLPPAADVVAALGELLRRGQLWIHLEASISRVRTVPSLAWVPLLLLWFGIDETPKLLLVAIGAFFPVYTTTASALSHVDAQLLEVGRAYGRHGVSLLTTVMLPAAAPELVNGLRSGLANAWLFLVAAELIASSKGLGFLLIDSQNTGRTDVMLLAIILLAALGKLSDSVLGALEHRMVRRRN
jgi:sulfonate transport system permease protein